MDKQQLKGQVSMELMILVGVAILILLIMMGITSQKINERRTEEEMLRADDMAMKVQKEIILASKVLDGYSRTFYLPQKLGNFEYNITIIGNELMVRTESQYSWVRIPLVIGDISKGYNTIKKRGDGIYIN